MSNTDTASTAPTPENHGGAAAPENPAVVELAAQAAAVVTGSIPMTEMAPFFDRAFSTLPDVLDAQRLSPVGAAFAWHDRQPTDTAELRVGFPVDGEVTPVGDVEAFTLPAGRVARLVHVGGYERLGESWGRLVAWADEQRLTPTGGFWEVYLTEPVPGMDPAELRTELNYPVR